MNTTSIRLCATAFTASAGLVLALTGCGSSSSPAPAASSAHATTGTSAAAAPGASALSIDGKSVSATFSTTCVSQGGLIALALTDTGNGHYGNLAVSATVSGGDSVQAVGITGSKGGSSGLPYAIAFGKGVPGGSASVTKSGNTFHVVGEGVGTPDPSNPTARVESSKFDITFVCPTVIGG
ncbi:lipoprotein LpqH [Nocardia miyunensis]|uniref:lipoprotein LpqH n=1 Tax=Nocardia miyunensis TaxID=282684 RepID=UPI000836101D|nr:lipoprotein LpqH [Nocardia miyunensis]